MNAWTGDSARETAGVRSIVNVHHQGGVKRPVEDAVEATIDNDGRKSKKPQTREEFLEAKRQALRHKAGLL